MTSRSSGALTPAQAVAQGRRILARRKAAERDMAVKAAALEPRKPRPLAERILDEPNARLRRALRLFGKAWRVPAIAETTVPRVSAPAPERWRRVWRRPTFSSQPTIVAAEINEPAPIGDTAWPEIDVVLDWLAGGMPAVEATSPAEGEGGGCQPRRATKPEKRGDLSTGRRPVGKRETSPSRSPAKSLERQGSGAPVDQFTKPAPKLAHSPQPMARRNGFSFKTPATSGVRPIKRRVESAPKSEAKCAFQQNPTSAAKPQQPAEQPVSSRAGTTREIAVGDVDFLTSDRTIVGPAGTWKPADLVFAGLAVMADGRLYGLDRIAKAAHLDEKGLRTALPLWTTCLRRIGVELVHVPHIGCKLNVIEVRA